MTKSQHGTLTALGLAILACVFLLAVGCGENPSGMIASGGNGADPSAIQYVYDNYGDPFSTDTQNADAGLTPLAKHFKFKVDGDSALIGASGGTLELQMRGFKSSLKIPKEALSSDVMITAEGVLVTTPFSEVLLYDFGPDGLVFNLPTELEVDAGQLENGTPFSLFWWNPVSESWEFQQEVLVKHHKLAFEVHHFSKYGIAAR
ncbi:MAG TPA: hypothetical protein VNN55_03985 [bacterium]|nr:hypothetical protein [bacterium]